MYGNKLWRLKKVQLSWILGYYIVTYGTKYTEFHAHTHTHTTPHYIRDFKIEMICLSSKDYCVHKCKC